VRLAEGFAEGEGCERGGDIDAPDRLGGHSRARRLRRVAHHAALHEGAGEQ